MDNRQNNSQASRRNAAAQDPWRKTATGSSSAARRSAQKPPATSAARNHAASAPRRKSSSATSRRRKRTNAPDVVYTPAAAFSRGKLLVGLLCVVAVVLALVFGISIFFHVDSVTVSGSEKYEEWVVMEASGIKKGDSLLGVNDAEVSGNIITRLPYIKRVRVGIKLPNTVNIYVEEHDVVYAVECTEGNWWLITEEGIVIERTKLDVAYETPRILGVQLDRPKTGEKAVPAEPKQPAPADPEAGEETHPQVTMASDRFNRAMQILGGLRDERIIGSIVYVNVSDLGNMRAKYAQQYTIALGDTIDLEYKLSNVGNVIKQLDKEFNNPVGTIDFSGSINGEYVFIQGVLDD